MPPADSWYDVLNPFTYLAGAAGKVAADAWTAAMLGLWNGGLWLLRLVLTISDAFLTPDLSEAGPGAGVFKTTFWIAGALVVVLAMVQIGLAAIRRDGRALAGLVLGTGQFAMVWSCWLGYGVLVLAACGGLSRALMQTLLGVDALAAWQPWTSFSTADITDGTVATVLGGMGCVLWLAAIGHLLVMLTRGGSLIILSATTPIAAAGLVADAGKSWFWKSLRWFHAAAFSPVLMVLVLGIGVQMTSGVATGLADGMQGAIGTAVPGVVLILISCFSPLALFKLLAFTDPGTSSGAALRQGLAAYGGLQGLLPGRGAGSGSSAAASTDANGRAAGEDGAEDATSTRFAKAASTLGSVGGALGQAAAAGLGAMATIGSKGAAIGSDLTNQMGVGHDSYHPDFSGMTGLKSKGSAGGSSPSPNQGSTAGPDDAHPPTDPAGTGAPTGPSTSASGAPDLPLPTPPSPPTVSAPPGSGGGTGDGAGAAKGGPKGGAGAAAGEAGGAEAAAMVVI